MQLTNRLNLPQPLVDAVRNDSYSRGGADISITELLGPPRVATLRRKHAEEIAEDASDRIWSLLGQSIHTILERSNTSGFAEQRLFMDCEGWSVSGGMDYVSSEGVLDDYKITSVYKIKDGVPNEFTQQLNCYAELLRSNGKTVTSARIIAILRDWSTMEAMRDPSYPQSQVVVLPVELWPSEQIKTFIKERVTLHKQARVELPLCTAEERWEKPTVFAVMKDGRKTAVRLYTSENEAKEHAFREKNHFIVKRPGTSIRCERYCSVNQFCSQYLDTQSEPEIA